MTRKIHSPVTFQRLKNITLVGFFLGSPIPYETKAIRLLDLRVFIRLGRILANTQNHLGAVLWGRLPKPFANRRKGQCRFRRGKYLLTSSSHSGLMLCMRGTGVMMLVLSLPKLLSSDAWSTTSSSLSATSTCAPESPRQKSQTEVSSRTIHEVHVRQSVF